jgi:hypothetical protein
MDTPSSILRKRLNEPDEFKSAMGIVQTIYAIAIVLAFRELAHSLFIFCFEKEWWLAGTGFDPLTLPLSLIAIVIVSFSLRFFWGVENIRRHVTRLEHQHVRRISRLIITVHVGVLVLQALLLYFLACIHAKIVDKMTLTPSLAYGFSITGIILLTLNSLWLVSLIYNVPERDPERFWIKNNAFFAVLALCLSVLAVLWSLTPYTLVVSVAIVYLLNSIRDFWETSHYYFGWHALAQSPAASISGTSLTVVDASKPSP